MNAEVKAFDRLHRIASILNALEVTERWRFPFEPRLPLPSNSLT